jgi:hypothetical protein
MCEPTTWIMIASAVFGAVGQQQQGAAAKSAAEANAKVQLIMADDAIARGEADVASQRRITNAAKGSQIAKFGASGAEINTGSSLEIIADTAEFGKLDELRIRSNAEREAFAHRSAAAIGQSVGSNAATTANLSALGTVLGAGGKVSSQWQLFSADNPGSTFGDFMGGNAVSRDFSGRIIRNTPLTG